MKLKSKFIFVFLFEFIALALLVLMAFLTDRRPLIQATGWKVEAGTHSGTPLPVKVYRMLGREMPLVIIVNDGQWQWPLPFTAFVFKNDADVTMTPSIHTSPFLYGNFDPYLGYGGNLLNIHKLEERWFLSCVDESVVFSNKNFFVSVSKEELP